MKELSLKEIHQIIETDQFFGRDVLGYAVDTRLLKPHDLYFALPGARVDGHDFLKTAAEKGASGAIVKIDYQGPDFGLPLLYSKDVLETLQTFAKIKLKNLKTRVIAVTGSLGKTTTKDFVSELLKTKYKLTVSPGNNNSQIGLPLTILNHVLKDHEYVVLEMGMTTAGHLKKLVEIAPPYAAIVTMVALVHACNFDSIEEIAKAKAEIFSHPDTKIGIYHHESNMANILGTSGHGHCKKVSFSSSSDNADYCLKIINDELHISEDKKNSSFALPFLSLPGIHNTHNFLAAVALAREIGVSFQEIKSAISSLKLPEKRLQFVEKYGALFVNDAYNASEVSIKAALDSLPKPKLGAKRIAVLGEIVELGKFSKMCHSSVADYALSRVDHMLCYGMGCIPILECWKAANRPVVWALERSEIVMALRELLESGDVVLLKGSNATGASKVLEEL